MKLSIIEAILIRLALVFRWLFAAAAVGGFVAVPVGVVEGAVKALLAEGVAPVFAAIGVGVADGVELGVVGRGDGDDVADALPGFTGGFEPVFLAGCSFLTVLAVAEGDAAVVSAAASSPMSLPLRFLPCRRHGSSGVARTRTSHGNLEGKKSILVSVWFIEVSRFHLLDHRSVCVSINK